MFPRSQSPRLIGRLLVLVLAILLGVVVSRMVGRSQPLSVAASRLSDANGRSVSGADLLVAPGASGDCSVKAPCGSIGAAFARASSGQVIEMAAGRYGQQDVEARPESALFSEAVIVRPAPGATVEVSGMEVFAQHLKVTGLYASGSLFIRPGAHHSGFEDMVTDGGTILVTAADNVVVRGNRVVPETDSDGIQIKGLHGVNPHNLLVEGNVVGPARRGPGRGHVDCIQLLGGEDVIIRGNVTFQCGTQSLIAGAGAGGTLPGPMLVENNVFHLCTVRTLDCDGYNAVNVNLPNLTFRHNTVVAGGAVFNDVRGLDVQANYFESLKTCAGEVQANLYAASACSPDASNLKGEATFIETHAEPPDLRMVPGSIGDGFGADVQFITSDSDPSPERVASPPPKTE